MAHFDSLLLEFGNLVNIPDLAVDHLGVCMLKIDDIEVLLQYRSATETLLVRATLGAIPPDVLEKVGEDAVYKRLLKANSFLYETEGFALGIDDPIEVISLYRIYDVRSTSMSFDDFELALSDCMNVAEKWVEYVQNFVRFMDEGASDVEVDPNDKLIQQAASMSSLENTSQQSATPAPQQEAVPAAQQSMSVPPRPAGAPSGVPPRPAPAAPSGVPPRPATPPSAGTPAGVPPRPTGAPAGNVPPRPAPAGASGVPPRPSNTPPNVPPRPAGTPSNVPPPPPNVPPKK